MIRRLWVVAAVAAVAAASCGRGGALDPQGQQAQDDVLVRTCTGCATQAYEAKDGFVVHEWGTFTNVVGSDGVLLSGLHHEEEDLPVFVADRIAAARHTPGTMQKMETPVTYFYAPEAMKVRASVRFPSGIFTQWFPWVRDFKPVLYFSDNGMDPVDPWLQASLSLRPDCEARFSAPPTNGLLDWGEFDLLAPGSAPALASPVGQGHYRFARNVASNPIRVPAPAEIGGAQHEQFLFYRGLGNFPLPLLARFEGDSPKLTNSGAKPLGGLILMNVAGDMGGFVELGDLPAGGELKSAVPALDQRLPDFVAQLKERLRVRLETDGLYRDEAQAMVDTWEQSYFHTPGVRLLYLLPQSETDRLLPLSISPAPRAMLRTMVIRVELMTPAQEKQHGEWLKELAVAATSAAARDRFLSLGRFAEPSLRRAIALTSDVGEKSAGETLLREVQEKQRWQPLSAQ